MTWKFGAAVYPRKPGVPLPISRHRIFLTVRTTSMLSNTNSGSEVYSREVLALVAHPGIEIMLHILNNTERMPQVFETLLKGPRFVENEPNKRKKIFVVNLMWKIGCLSAGQQIFPTKQDISPKSV
ncbi:hypothetical protein VP01_12967g1, partial [Puccinia sorghi]